MKTTIANLIVVAALSFSGAALSAEEAKGKMQPPAAQPAAPASAVPPAPTAKLAAPAPVQEPQPEAKPSAPAKAKPPRSKTLDLRHCLDLESNAEITKCAGE